MNQRKVMLLLSMFWMTGCWVSSLALPSIAAQSTQHDIQKSVIQKREDGFLLKSSAEKTRVPAPLLHTNVNIMISGLIARTTVAQ